MKKIISVVGARPNFMKIAPLERELKRRPEIEKFIVHTGQHYDKDMSDVFFEQLGLPKPERSLGVGSGGHGAMTGRIMIGFEKACLEIKPDLVIVVGDVNSTIAASLVARKLFIPVAHVESGLRSFDETMPEELNRRLTDCLSNLLFVSEPSGMLNLEREGADMGRVHLVGDIMLETLQMFLPVINGATAWKKFGLEVDEYCLITIHRPSNVDTREALSEVLDIIEATPFPKIFPIHPRTIKKIEEFGFTERIAAIPDFIQAPPQPYTNFLSLLQGCKLIISDSGSVQGEASFFDKPCLVCRENTERPFYQEYGTSKLIGRSLSLFEKAVGEIQAGSYPRSTNEVREIGSHVGRRVVDVIAAFLNQ